jgi:hypothetical protein
MVALSTTTGDDKMSFVQGLPVNFTISDAAKAEINHLRSIWQSMTNAEPDVMSVAWGNVVPNNNPVGTYGYVVVAFYPPEYRAEIAHALEHVSGLELLFFITKENHHRFAGKIIHHTADKSFHLI